MESCGNESMCARVAETGGRVIRGHFPICAVLMVLGCLSARAARADLAPRWSDTELVAFADVILTGQVTQVAAGWDHGVIYTYITLDVGDVLKGWVPERQIVLKQLGGRVGDLALMIGGQAAFRRGEQVLAFLEARPRDRTLSTTALWQGKWNIDTDSATGQKVAARRTPPGADLRAFGPAADARPLSAFMDTIRQAVGPNSVQRSQTDIDVLPRESRDAVPVRDVDAASIFSPRWTREMLAHSPIPLEIQRSGQPGLPGGGLDVVTAAAHRTAVLAGLTLTEGIAATATCFASFTGDGTLSVAFNDACGEMSPTGGTLALSGAWTSTSTGTAGANGAFMQILQAGIIANAGRTADAYLKTKSCLQAIETYEFMHALGSDVVGTRSSPFLDRACVTGASANPSAPLRSLNLGVRFGSTPQPATAPATVVQTTRVSVASDGSQLTTPSGSPSISPDGRVVVFGNNGDHLLLHDNQTGQTVEIARGTRPRVTSNGRYVVFTSPDGLLAAYDRTTGATTVFTVPPRSDLQPGTIYSVSDDLRYVAYPAASFQLAVLDRTTGTVSQIPTQAISVSAVLSPDGRHLAYKYLGNYGVIDRQTGQTATPPRPEGNSPVPIQFSADNRYLLTDAYLYDLVLGRSVFSPLLFRSPAISANGRFVAYTDTAIKIYDQQTSQTLRVDVTSDGRSANGASGGPSVDNSGRVAFASTASNLVPGDTNGVSDVFLTIGGVDAALPGEPQGLTSTVTRVGSGSTVVLTWSAFSGGGKPSSYIIEAGYASGLSDAAVITVPANDSVSTQTFEATVSAGTFFVRVRAANASAVSLPSNETIVTVGGEAAPGTTRDLRVFVNGSTVTLTWAAPLDGAFPTTYVIEAGSSSGRSDLANFSTDSTATSFTATGVGPGTYFVRVLAGNNTGAGAPSNEVVLLDIGTH